MTFDLNEKFHCQFQLEMSGDWFLDFSNSGPMPYWWSFYLVVVTMSTVGYGDVTCKTVSGKIFLCIFILTTLVIFRRLYLIQFN